MQQDSEPSSAPPRKRAGGRPLRARTDPGVLAAIDAAGSIGALAAKAGVTTGAVSVWKRVPGYLVSTVASALNLSRHQLRPDLFDRDDQPIPTTTQPK